MQVPSSPTSTDGFADAWQRPVATPVDPTGQWIVTVACFVLTALLLVALVRRYRRDPSAVPVLLVLTVAVGSCLEPLWDNANHLLFYIPGQWSLYTAFDVPQPIWVWAGYVCTYGAAGLYVYCKARDGATARDLWVPGGIMLVGLALFDLIATGLGDYEYYGDGAFRINGFPIWVAPLHLACAFLTGVLAALADRHCAGLARIAGGLLAFPLAYGAAEFGCGFPGIVTLNMNHHSALVLHLGATLAVVLSCMTIWVATHLLPLCAGEPASSEPVHA